MNVVNRVLGWLNKYRSVFALIVASFLLLVAQSSFWINQTIFDQATFTSITTDVLTTEESRSSVATTVVDQALAERPVVKRIAGEKATQLVTGLLGTDLATQTINTAVNKSYAFLTSERRDPIEIDLLPIKTPLAGLVSFAESQGRDVQFDPDSVPDTILLFDPSDIPSTYEFSSTMLWVGPICWLGAFGLFAIYLYRGRKAYAKRTYIVGAVIIATSLLGLMAGPILPSTVSTHIQIIEMRSVVNDLISALLMPFINQMLITTGVTLVVLFIFSQRRTIVNFSQKLLAPTQKATAKTTTQSAKTTKKSTAVKKPRNKSRTRR